MQYCLIYSGTRLLSTELKLPNLPMDSVLIQYYLFTYLTLVELLVLVKFLSPAQWWIKLALGTVPAKIFLGITSLGAWKLSLE